MEPEEEADGPGPGPSAPHAFKGHHAAGVPAGAARPHHTRGRGTSASSVHPLPLPLSSRGPGPESLEKGALGSSVARRSSPRRLALCRWRSVSAHQPRARLSSGSLESSGGCPARGGPSEGATSPAGASHAAPAPKPRARPGPRPPGRGSVEGVRRKSEPRRAPPSGARGRWAGECCHPLTGGSDPPLHRGQGRDSG